MSALICNFTCEITKLPLQRESQCQDGDEVLKCHEGRCQGIKRRFRRPEHTKENIKKDSNRYFVEKL